MSIFINMSLDIFKEQISLYKSGDHSDFRRINLVYSFQDLVNTLASSEDITSSIVSSIESLTQLHIIDPKLFSEISPDLLEPTIRLQILMAPKFPKALTQLSISLATYSRASEFQKELSTIMTLLNSNESSHPFEQFRNAQGPGNKDIFKTVITFYIPIILRMLEDSEIREGIEKLMDFVEFIKSELQEYHASLGSELMPEIFQVLCERKACLKKNAGKETMVFLLEILNIYESIRIFDAQKRELIEAICEIFGDFSQVLKEFGEWKLDMYNPLAILAGKVIKGKHEKLALPLVFSGMWRLKVLIPAAVMCSYADTRNKLISYSLYYSDGSIDLRSITCCYPTLTPIILAENSLNNIYMHPGSSLKQGKVFIRNFFMRFSINDRAKLIESLIFKSKNEETMRFFVSIMASSNENGKYFMKIIKGLLELRPVIEYTMLFYSLSKYLGRINKLNSIKSLEIYEAVKELYSEIAGNLNTSYSKINQILAELRKII